MQRLTSRRADKLRHLAHSNYINRVAVIGC
jgi:hypothetical protein